MTGSRMKALIALLMYASAALLLVLVLVAAAYGEVLIAAVLAASGVALGVLANVLVESMGDAS